ncbi:SDR family oxidoreductase [Georgenia faecalis]|uniref:SDR family oxidoreductase n=1 Tax=Georgenia faecalis TaxID=2483799 RepID=A0ABV9D8J8_9MICO|nr:SDR family oxidoreductase [Georgenia faecalis]
MAIPDPTVRRVLVTGAARGIGRAIAAALADDAALVLTVRRPADAEELRSAFPGAQVLLLDLAAPAAVAGACAGLPDVDALVHCAGVEGVAPAADLTPDLLAAVLTTNVAGPVELTRTLLPGLRRQRGHVVFVSSTAALRTIPGWSAYTASKAAVRAYADTLRAEEAAHHVRVTSVFPGRTDTGMQRRIAAQAGREFDPATAMDAASVAGAVRYVLDAPADAVVPELTVEPAP